MKKKLIMLITLVLIALTVCASAATLEATVLLPDGNPAPLATVSVGEKEFAADRNGKVVLEVPEDIKIVTVKWLEAEAELPVSETLKLKNRRLYSAPYDIEDFFVHGADIWEVSDNEIVAAPGSESQLFYEDAFENTLLRAKFTLGHSDQWYYVRFFTRLYDPGFNGYSVSFPGKGEAYYARYEGNWDVYSDIPPRHLAFKGEDGTEYEMVMLNKDERFALWLRETSEDHYRKLFDITDNTDGAYYDGGFAITCSYLSVTLTEVALFGI